MKTKLIQLYKDFLQDEYNFIPAEKQIIVEQTKKEFEGDYTIVLFPVLRLAKESPVIIAEKLINYLQLNSEIVSNHNLIKAFLNISIADKYWIEAINSDAITKIETKKEKKTIVIEFSSPNTNKPQHLGHIRNNLIGDSMARILSELFDEVKKVNLINDRGIHICKTMYYWMNFANGKTPKDALMKGDKFVGSLYVNFETIYKKQIQELVEKGTSKEKARKEATIIKEAQKVLQLWENNDAKIRKVWKMMNDWVYEGFNDTYKKLGIHFDKLYYESETYSLGKEIIYKALEEKVLGQKDDNSIWIDLKNDGLDEKLLLRSDGTSVYMTQDIGTAKLRYDDFSFDESIYVVGNEQEYHFKVLKLSMKKMGFSFADKIKHLSYGMVELPEGKMKSREGTTVDADDLLDEMIKYSEEQSKELGKLSELTEEDKKNTIKKIALAALKYFIIKVDAKKNMLFNPKASIDFQGDTGPFILYTYTRIASIFRKTKTYNLQSLINQTVDLQNSNLSTIEKSLISNFLQYNEIMKESASKLDPSIVAKFVYKLAKDYNHFYHELHILNEKNEAVKLFRLKLSAIVASYIKKTFNLLGIEVVERM